jgi:hypothetical protein
MCSRYRYSSYQQKGEADLFVFPVAVVYPINFQNICGGDVILCLNRPDKTMREQAAAWSKMKTGTLADLNAFVREQNMKTIQISEIEREVYELMTR